MTVTGRTALLTAIRDDYEKFPADRKNESFVYRYLKAECDRKAEANVSDKAAYIRSASAANSRTIAYVRLKSAYRAFEKGYIDADDYWDVHHSIFRTKKHDPDIKREEARRENDLISAVICNFFSAGGFKRKKPESGIYCYESSDVTFDPDRHIHAENAGKKKGGKKTPLAEKEHEFYRWPEKAGSGSSYKDYVEILYRFSLYLGETDAPAGSPQTGTTDETACERLYDDLVKSGKDDLFVPLYIDCATGAGVYIIGSANIDPAEGILPEDGEQSCYPCLVYFSEIGRDDLKESRYRSLVEIKGKLIALRETRRKYKERIKEIIVQNKLSVKDADIERAMTDENVLDALFADVNGRLGNDMRLYDELSDIKMRSKRSIEEGKKLTRIRNKLRSEMLEYDSVSQIMHIERASSVRDAFDMLRNCDAFYDGYCDINDGENVMKALSPDTDEKFLRFIRSPAEPTKRVSQEKAREREIAAETEKREAAQLSRYRSAGVTLDPIRRTMQHKHNNKR